MKINCKEISDDIYEKLSEEICEIEWNKPTLWVILVWNDSASLRYIGQKKKFCEQVGMWFELLELETGVSETTLLEHIKNWNSDNNISGYIVQLPLPQHINEQKVIDSIAPHKDVDWFHPVNQGKILLWDTSWFAPCTPAGVMEILFSESLPFHSIAGTPFEKGRVDKNDFLSGKHAVVIGRSNIVGKPLMAMLVNAWATVTICNSKTPDISVFTKHADIVICATGVPGLLKLEHINDSTIVIDVWFTVTYGKIYGDACFDEIHENGNLITPVPGWPWRLTVAQLLSNTLKAWKQQNT